MNSRNSPTALVQALEIRRLLSADFARISSHGTLLIVGDSGSNVIAVELDAPQQQMTVTRDGQSLSFADASVARVSIDAGAGDDFVDLSAGPVLKTTILGGIFARDHLVDRVYGGGGIDSAQVDN